MPVNVESSWSSTDTQSLSATPTGVNDDSADMESWSSDTAIINNLIIGTYTNKSSFDIPAAVFESNAKFSSTGEASLSVVPSGVNADGAIMDSWNSRSGILNNLLAGTFTNQSSFEIPASVIESTTTFSQSDEDTLGVIINADFRDVDSTPISGTASLVSGGSVINSASSSGFISLTSDLPPGVESGEDVTGSTGSGIEVRFAPSSDGLTYSEVVSGATDVGQIKYGEITGQVTDANGDPVSGERVEFGQNSFFTDSNGGYTVKGPGGQESVVNALRGSADISISFSGGSSTTQDFQYGGLSINVSLPDGDGIEGVVVEADSTLGKKTTDSNGDVEFSESQVGGSVAVAIGDIIVSAGGPSQGQVTNVSKQVGFGVKGNIQDSEGASISAVEVKTDAENPISSSVGRTGEFKIGADDSGTVAVIIGDDDRRYQRTEFEVDVQQGDIVDNVVVELEEKENIGTSV